MSAINKVSATALRRISLFQGLDDSGFDAVLTIAQPQRFAPSATIFEKGSPGDALYVILRGEVAVFTVSSEGRMLLHNRLTAGDTLGEIALIDGLERTAGATALTQVHCVRFDRSTFLPLVRRDAALSWNLLQASAALVRHVSAGREDAIFLDVRHRLAKQILRLADTYGQAGSSGVRVTRSVTQEELAQLLGVSREIVNRSLRLLTAAGEVLYDRGFLVIPDIERLRAIATEDQGR